MLLTLVNFTRNSSLTTKTMSVSVESSWVAHYVRNTRPTQVILQVFISCVEIYVSWVFITLEMVCLVSTYMYMFSH